MKHTGRMSLTVMLVSTVMTLSAGCAEIRTHREFQQPVGATLSSGIGGTIFRLNKVGDLPNAFGGRDIWGGKVDKGFAEMKLAGIEGQALVLDIIDVNRQSTESVMDRYKPFQQNKGVNIDIQNTIVMGSQQSPRPYRINLDTTKQRDIVISGVRVTFVEVQPYSIRYTLEDVQP